MAADEPIPEPEEERPAALPTILMPAVAPDSTLLNSPILLMLLFHRALREELVELLRIAVESSESVSDGRRDTVLELVHRFEFFKLVYKYHSAGEDEGIFRALDVHVKNVVSTYSLEHRSTDDIVDSISHYLGFLIKEDEGDISKTFQELVYFIGLLQTTICKHMDKEEEQVFPLLLQQFSSEEQALLVWQFLCSVPMILLQDFLLWMTSFLSSDERVDVLHCLKEAVPKDILIQEVVISWLDAEKQTSFGDYGKYGKRSLFLIGGANFQKIFKEYLSEDHCGEEEKRRKPTSAQTTDRGNLVDVVHLWHGAFRKDLKEILGEIYSIRNSNDFSGLVPVVVQLKFFADVLIFYSIALDKIFYPLCTEFAKDCPTPTYQQFLDDSQIEGLQQLLYKKAESEMPLRDFVEMLCGKLEVCVKGIDKHLNFLETEVFAFIGMNFSPEIQIQLLYASLEIMPLGLLRCTIIWFSTHLSEDKSKLILSSIKEEGYLANKLLSSLVYEWVRVGYSGKTSVENFKKDLQEIFNNRCSSLSEHMEDSALFCLHLDMQPNERSNSRSSDTTIAANAENCVSSSSSSCGSTNTKIYEMPYSSWINFHVFFPQTWKTSSPFSTFPIENNRDGSFPYVESKPVDYIFLFHKALRKDLEHLVFVSANLADNDANVMDFYHRFHLVRFLYQIHSDSEDEIAFPALEAKGKIRNSSHSYTIDHKLEIEHFNRISFILEQISELRTSISSGDVNAQDGRPLKYRQLCMKLHDMCKSINRILCDHVNHEEVELWPLFREHLSLEEQEKIIGCMLGRIRAETLQEMIPWLMASLTPEEQHAMMSLWRKATKNTMFDQWLREWWEGMKRYDIAKVEEESSIPSPQTADQLEFISTYLMKEGFHDHQGNLCNKGSKLPKGCFNDYKVLRYETIDAEDNVKDFGQDQNQSSGCNKFCSEVDKKTSCIIADVADQTDETEKLVKVTQSARHQEDLLKMSQEELEASIRRVYSDSTLDPHKKSFMIQNLLMSRWIDAQKKSHPEVIQLNHEQEVPGQCPSYRDPLKLEFGCQHYKRNCKLVAACCNKLYTCRHCHDDKADHLMDRKATTRMMCMKCLIIQPIGQTCSTVSCSYFSMARYYCRICKLFDDERQIYHCPYCNLCRLGKGLGIDYFHCMNCNACMSRSLSVHICREKCFEDNCPICREYIFTSSSPVKALPCGHLMHSSCFQDYTCSNYSCPICSKSLGDMKVYFGMLDALLAEEKIPDEYSGKSQVILCNDCEKRGTAPFHWLYHKCSNCGSYNTRLL